VGTEVGGAGAGRLGGPVDFGADVGLETGLEVGSAEGGVVAWVVFTAPSGGTNGHIVTFGHCSGHTQATSLSVFTSCMMQTS
jgi:hypothetical protein